MFEKARLKLTLWYLLTIMIVSLSFSAVIYKGATNEFERSLDTIEQRLRLRQFGLLPPEGRELIFIQDLIDTRNKIVLLLIYINGTILMLSSVASYFLAGKTLEPIEESLEKQKRFVADASHELKTPITSLQTSIEVALRDKNLKIKTARTTLKDALKDVEQLKLLTENLLILARVSDSNSVKQPINIKKTLTTIEKRFKPIAKLKSVNLSFKSPKLVVLTSEHDLEKIISILIDNAIKYTPKNGRVELVATRNKKSLVIKAVDTGIGISKKDQTKIFDRFYRADSSRSNNEAQGHGLGLSIAEDIASKNGWKLTVKSKVNKGTTFTLTLPF